MTSAGSSLRPSRTDSVIAAQASLFSRWRALFSGFAGLFSSALSNVDMDRSQNLFSIAHIAFSVESAISVRVGPRHTVDHLACNRSQKPVCFIRDYSPTCLQPRMLFSL